MMCALQNVFRWRKTSYQHMSETFTVRMFAECWAISPPFNCQRFQNFMYRFHRQNVTSAGNVVGYLTVGKSGSFLSCFQSAWASSPLSFNHVIKRLTIFLQLDRNGPLPQLNGWLSDRLPERRIPLSKPVCDTIRAATQRVTSLMTSN